MRVIGMILFLVWVASACAANVEPVGQLQSAAYDPNSEWLTAGISKWSTYDDYWWDVLIQDWYDNSYVPAWESCRPDSPPLLKRETWPLPTPEPYCPPSYADCGTCSTVHPAPTDTCNLWYGFASAPYLDDDLVLNSDDRNIFASTPNNMPALSAASEFGSASSESLYDNGIAVGYMCPGNGGRWVLVLSSGLANRTLYTTQFGNTDTDNNRNLRLAFKRIKALLANQWAAPPSLTTIVVPPHPDGLQYFMAQTFDINTLGGMNIQFDFSGADVDCWTTDPVITNSAGAGVNVIPSAVPGSNCTW